MKISPVEPSCSKGEVGRAKDRRIQGQTDMKKLIVAFRNFANAPINHAREIPHLKRTFLVTGVKFVHHSF